MKRKGITLTEALVALFIAALGMISLLTLFPLGAMQMGQALKDARTAQGAQEADGLMRWYWAKYETNPAAQSPILLALDRGDNLPNAQWIPSTSTAASYPVFVDPQGYDTTWLGSPATQQRRLANLQGIARRTLTAPTTTGTTVTYPTLFPTGALYRPYIERFTILQDEYEYTPDQKGVAGFSSDLAGKVQRGAQYSWSWLLQRPNNDKRGLINLTVVVYFKRSPFFGDADSERVIPNVAFTPGSTGITLNYSGTKPSIVKGRWIMDSTESLRHAKFYRVVSVRDVSNTQMEIELETPVTRLDKGTAGYTGSVVVFNRVAEVFERPPLITGDTSNN